MNINIHFFTYLDCGNEITVPKCRQKHKNMVVDVRIFVHGRKTMLMDTPKNMIAVIKSKINEFSSFYG